MTSESAAKGIRAAVLYDGAVPAGRLRADLPLLFIVVPSDLPRLGPALPALWPRVIVTQAPWSLLFANGLPRFPRIFPRTGTITTRARDNSHRVVPADGGQAVRNRRFDRLFLDGVERRAVADNFCRRQRRGQWNDSGGCPRQSGRRPAQMVYHDQNQKARVIQAGRAIFVSAAIFSPTNLANSGIASCSGGNLVTTTVSGPSLPLPTSLDGTSIKVKDIFGREFSAELFSSRQRRSIF